MQTNEEPKVFTSEQWYTLGKSQLNEEPEKALESFNNAIELAPNDIMNYSYKGSALSRLGRYQEEIDVHNKAISLKPDHNYSYYYKGIALYKLGRSEEALKAYNRAIELKLEYSGIYHEKGVVLAALNKKEEALKAYDKAIELKPDYASAYYNKGVILETLGQKEATLEAFNKVIEIKPDYYSAYYNKGVVLAALNKKEEALEAYNKSIELKQSYDNAYNNKGVILEDLGRKEEALEAYNNSIEINPNHYNAYNNKACILQALGRKEEALEAFNKAIEINPSEAIFYYNQGITLSALDKKLEAIEAYSKAIELKPDYASAYHNKGIALNVLGKKEEAIKASNKAIELNPDNPDYSYVNGVNLLSKANTHIELKEFEQADKILRNPIFKKINDITIEDTVLRCHGKCLYEMKEYNEALEKLNSALSLNPDASEAILYKVKCLKKLGLKDEATKEENEQLIRNINNKSVLAEKALSLLNENRPEEADKYFKRAKRLGIDGKEFQICYHFIRALLLKDKQKYYEALKSINEALGFKMKYEELNLYRHKAELLTLIGQYKGAMDCCNYVLTNESEEISEENRRRVLMAKAISYYELGEIGEAEQLIKVYNLNQTSQMVKEEVEETGKLLYFPKKGKRINKRRIRKK